MGKGKNVISIVVFFITVMLIAVMSVQFRTVEETNSTGIQQMEEDELRAEIKKWKTKYEEVQTKLNETNGKISEYTETIEDKNKSAKLINDELNEYNMLLGKTNVVGSGVVITLTDNALNSYTARKLVYLVNELKYAGAEAISINGHRIINLTDIVTIQEKYMLVGGERITSPYEVKAIGDKQKLNDVLAFPNNGYIDSCKSAGYTIDMRLDDNVHIPAYNKDITLKYVIEK